MSMKLKKKVNELEGKVDQIIEYIENNSQSEAPSTGGKD